MLPAFEPKRPRNFFHLFEPFLFFGQVLIRTKSLYKTPGGNRLPSTALLPSRFSFFVLLSFVHLLESDLDGNCCGPLCVKFLESDHSVFQP